ncbi:undecaprenyl-phosphate glucose phosphotransferase [Danxiaibacter flavus]|uniref:Undecaprenyl-phosphate glucose phosphotransferase n=1 Tax=Danxiaibacter flavus TaxID=3049108 RepID=A0ABV3ZLG1_9BACT|nr:undecaprenyl-phosphate glucose phosphotransferase [Chitinophagaceae bacterium DXS]
MNSRFIYHLQVVLFLLDLVVCGSLFVTEYFLLKGTIFFPEANFFENGICLLFIWISITYTVHVYNADQIISFYSLVQKTKRSFLYFVIASVFFSLLLKAIHIPLGAVIYFTCSLFISLAINRILYLGVYSYYSKQKHILSNVVVIGFNSLSKKIIESLERSAVNKKIIGICDEPENQQELFHYPIISSITDTIETCKKLHVTEIYSSIAPEQNSAIYHLIEEAEQHCIHFRIVPDMSVFFKQQFHMDYMHGMPVISLRKEPLEDLSNRILKRLFDILFSLAVMIFILSWLMPLIGILILMDSEGPIFFIQMRSGKNLLPFPCIKFRSMRVNNSANEKQATKNDERFTRLGKFLRHTNLDEFPQFLNVLKGQMSIVGPRPHMLKHTEQYSQNLHQYMSRHLVKPGITGWAQINGYRGEITSADNLRNRIRYDLQYLENWSIWLDLKIILLTVINTIKGDKNAF